MAISGSWRCRRSSTNGRPNPGAGWSSSISPAVGICRTSPHRKRLHRIVRRRGDRRVPQPPVARPGVGRDPAQRAVQPGLRALRPFLSCAGQPARESEAGGFRLPALLSRTAKWIGSRASFRRTRRTGRDCASGPCRRRARPLLRRLARRGALGDPRARRAAAAAEDVVGDGERLAALLEAGPAMPLIVAADGAIAGSRPAGRRARPRRSAAALDGPVRRGRAVRGRRGGRARPAARRRRGRAAASR